MQVAKDQPKAIINHAGWGAGVGNAVIVITPLSRRKTC